ncbi:MAG: TIGR02266 family protein [Deltaproteobacteria bacterium]|nr:TIGR02266 family protein [Deltaproteobacteria bacterium]
MTDEFRQFGRVPVALEVRYASTCAFLVAYTTNLSKGGVFLETPTPLPVGSEITLTISAPHAPEPMVVEGRVAWVRDQSDPEGHPVGMGVQFSQLEQRYGAVIDHIVTRFEGVCILVVSSSSATRSHIVRYLKSIITAQVVEAEDITTVVQVLAARVDLCIVDLDDGAQGEVALLAAHDRAEHPVPVIALAREEEIRVRGGSLGADEALPSPPPFGALQQAVIRCLAKPAAVT